MDIPAFSLSENPAKLQHLCRMCATPCNKPVPIFGSIGVENELAMKFNNYLPLKVCIFLNIAMISLFYFRSMIIFAVTINLVLHVFPGFRD